MKLPALISDVRRVFAHVSDRRRRQVGLVVALMLAGAIAELVSIGALLPFLTLLADASKIDHIAPLRALTDRLGLTTDVEIRAAAAAVFVVAALIAAAVRLLLTWVSQRFVQALGQELGVGVYRRTLHQSYAYHTARNSSHTQALIHKVQQVTNGLLLPLMQATSALMIASFVVVGLIVVDPAVALVAGASFGTIYFLVMRVARTALRRNGAVIARAQRERIQAVNEGLGGIRDVLLDHSQSVFVQRFSRHDGELRRAQATTQFLAAAPRFLVEAFGMVLIALIALAISYRPGGLLGALPTLGALALGAQRLLPLLQLMFTGWSGYVTFSKSLSEVLEALEMPLPPQYQLPPPREPLPFEREIRLEKVSFNYPAGARPVLHELDVVIPAGSRVAIVGKTGSGKSTLMDLLLGLLSPTEGRILIDGAELDETTCRAWQRQIAHVPQSIYLADTSLAENIAFGVPRAEIDFERLREAAEKAELSDVIDGLADGYDTLVGERGIRLSGGQRQRIGIARALYKRASVLVFDEATSALDGETERAVMEAIERLDRSLTILMIAHRLSTLEGCDMRITLEAGRLRSEPSVPRRSLA